MLGDPRLLWLALALVAILLALHQLNHANSWRPPFFFDEMWRVDFIRTSLSDLKAEMQTHDTPTAFGWVLLMKLVMAPLPSDPISYRVVGAGFMVLGLMVIAVLLVRIGERGERDHRIPAVAGAGAAAALMFASPVSQYAQYFTNYGFEVLYTALIVLAAEELDRSRRALPALCVLVALAPGFVLGGLFVLPAIVVGAAWQLRDRRRELLALAAACVVCALIAAATWIQLYRPIGDKPTIKSYWIDRGSSLGGDQGIFDLLSKALHQTRDGLVGQRVFDAGGAIGVLGTLVLVAGALIGIAVLLRRFPLLVAAAVSAQLFAIIGSAAVHWPMTVERVNLCFQVLSFAIVFYGVAVAIAWLLRRAHLPTAVAGVAFALVLWGMWFRPTFSDTHNFARDLVGEMNVVADSPAPRNLVVQYHWMAHFYAHDALINTRHPGHEFDVVAERPDDTSLYEPIDAVIARGRLRRGDMLWCVVPLAVGPMGGQACRFTQPRLRQVVDQPGQASVIRGFEVR